jgi:hypothetical protein
MKTLQYLKQYLFVALITGFIFGCVDNMPEVEELPSAAVNFNYLVVDDSYQLDYYTGANIEFSNISALTGSPTWDFGDGTPPVTGNVVPNKINCGRTEYR